jgi:3-oxoacyl-[acyl-carrier-protein] synthase II
MGSSRVDAENFEWSEGEMENGRPAAYVTGVGVVGPIGVGKKAFWGSLLANESGVGPITLFDPDGFEVTIAAECSDFDPKDFMERKAAQRTDRFAQLGLAAAKLALEDADAWGELENNAERVGLILGSGLGGVASMEDTQRTIDTKGPARVNPFAVTRIMPNSAAAHVGIQLGVQGPSAAPALACACGTDSMGLGYDLIRRGDADVVICGAAEATIAPVIVAGFIAMRAMSRNNENPEAACRPYDKDHAGFVIGEASAVLILESRESVEGRGGETYTKITGVGRSTDAYNITDPDPKGSGITRAMRLALESAGVEGERVGYINPHGTGTAAGDGPESNAMHAINPKAMVSATKSTLGHSMGATGAVEAAICALAVKERVVPPMRNLSTLAEGCAQLDYVVDEPREAPDLEAALCANLGVGGHNAAIVLERA